MSNDAMWVIEKYLQLVKAYLPDTIADDVVSEIRAHLTEAAEELSEGEITVEAAKRVVAGFGAPLEVAREYADSMATDQLKRVEVIEREPVEISYLSIFTKAITLTVFWMSISWTMAIPFAWWLPQTSALIFPLFQFMVLAVGLAFMLWSSKRKGIQLLDRINPEWSGLQRLLTFPENTPFRKSGNESRARFLHIHHFGGLADLATVPQIALAWLLAKPFVATVILGANSVEQLQDNLGAADVVLAEEDVTVLDDLTAGAVPYPAWMQGMGIDQKVRQALAGEQE